MAANDAPKALVEALDLIRGTKGPKPESLDVLESKQVRRVQTIFEDRNIVAIGIAEKAKTGELGLCLYVEKKIAKSKIKSNKFDSAGLERGRPHHSVHRCARDRQSPPANSQATPTAHQGAASWAGWPVLRDLSVYQQLTEVIDARSKHE
jgi:hypothetical protein